METSNRGGSSEQPLRGGGELGARFRLHDWTRTAIGAAERWPQSLRSAVGICLNAQFPIAIYWGPELALLYNDAWSPILGEKHPGALGRPGREVWPEIWDTIGPLFDRVQQTGEGVWVQDQLLPMHRHGYTEECYFNFTFSPLHGDDGSIAGIFNAVIETTFRVIEERRLRSTQELAQTVAGAGSAEEVCKQAALALRGAAADVPFCLFYSLDEGGSARLMATTGVVEPAQLCPSEISSQDTRAIWRLPTASPIIVQGLSARLGAVRAGPWPEAIEQAVLLPLAGAQNDHPAGFLVAAVSPRRVLDGAYHGYLGRLSAIISNAIAEAHNLAEERRRTEALAQIDRAKTLFFSNVSHELRTPLTLVLGPLEQLLAQNDLAPNSRGHAELARRSSLRLLKLVNSLLDFSRLEAGRVQTSIEPTDLATFTRDIASMFRSTIEQAGLRFDVICEAIPTPVSVDRAMWEKIVLNLLSNAFKYTLNGSIRVGLTSVQNGVVLEVADTGVGIPPSELHRVFERFYRVSGTVGRSQEGTGIGLSLTAELVKLHGGRIELTSQVGVGTTVEVQLPRGRSPNASFSMGASDPRPVAAEAFVYEASGWMSLERSVLPAILSEGPAIDSTRGDRRFAATFGSRILLTEDNADMRAYVRNLLSPLYFVEEAADGVQALSAINRRPPDLVVSDVMMPHLDGFELLQRIRGNPVTHEIPIILLSARAGEESRLGSLDAGADDYVVKPFSARELLARVGASLERRHAREALRRRTAQYETLLNDAPIGVYLVDAAFKIREMNPMAAAVFGEIPGLIGRDFAEVIHLLWPRPYADELVARFRDTLATGLPCSNPEHIEQRLDRGTTEYYEWQIHRIPLPDGSRGVVCYFRDISAHIQSRRALETADRQKNEFLAMLAHELRNPLAPIGTANEILSRITATDARAQQAVAVIQRQVKQLARLVDDLLDVSRITRGRIQLQPQVVDLNIIVSQALETVRPQFQDKQQRVCVEFSPLPIHVSGDGVRLVQCVVNVLANAAKYTDSNDSIRVGLWTKDDIAIIEVSDDGTGIAPELMPHIFELFVQGDRTLDRAQGGLGVGLAVVKRLIEMHDGVVTARSDGIGRGSTFEIRLPRLAHGVVDRDGEQAGRSPS